MPETLQTLRQHAAISLWSEVTWSWEQQCICWGIDTVSWKTSADKKEPNLVICSPVSGDRALRSQALGGEVCRACRFRKDQQVEEGCVDVF